MDISKEVIDRILEISATQTFLIDGRTYSTKSLNLVQYQENSPTPLKINTLKGIVDFIKANVDKLPLEQLMLVVQNEHSVTLQSELKDPSKKRNTYLEAIIQDDQRGLFGRFCESDQFIINLMTMFQKSGTRDELIKILSSIKTENGVQTSDDGMGQSVTAKVGVALVDKVNIKNPWTLAPYRTFREIEQPESAFVVRLSMSGNKPLIALFESDGGGWILEAIENIAKYLKGELPEITIIA